MRRGTSFALRLVIARREQVVLKFQPYFLEQVVQATRHKVEQHDQFAIVGEVFFQALASIGEKGDRRSAITTASRPRDFTLLGEIEVRRLDMSFLRLAARMP